MEHALLHQLLIHDSVPLVLPPLLLDGGHLFHLRLLVIQLLLSKIRLALRVQLVDFDFGIGLLLALEHRPLLSVPGVLDLPALSPELLLA